MRQDRVRYIAGAISLAILMVLMCSIGVRFLTRQILVERLHMDNEFTEFVLKDAGWLLYVPEAPEGTEEIGTSIDWAALYPFAEDAGIVTLASESGKDEADDVEMRKSRNHIVERIEGVAHSVKSPLEIYATEYIAGYDSIVRLAKRYEGAIQWNYASYAGYNEIIAMKDGYLTRLSAEEDTRAAAEATIDFAHWCKDRGIDFLYVQAPHKISKYEDVDISGIVDFCNQNADELLSALEAADVDTYDVREVIREERLPHHDLFYRTDHHWKGESGLWAAQHILEQLQERYGYDVNASILDSELFEKVVYPESFLGSQGNKQILVERDDLSLLYPIYTTALNYQIPSVLTH